LYRFHDSILRQKSGPEQFNNHVENISGNFQVPTIPQYPMSIPGIRTFASFFNSIHFTPPTPPPTKHSEMIGVIHQLHLVVGQSTLNPPAVASSDTISLLSMVMVLVLAVTTGVLSPALAKSLAATNGHHRSPAAVGGR
jgi:hypothetical protein